MTFDRTRLINSMLSVTVTAYAVLLIVFSGRLNAEIYAAVLRCINVIIPSLFVFMAVSDLLIRSGGYIFVSKLLSPFTVLIGLPRELGSVFLLSNTAGYPVGASMISAMYDEGRLSEKSAARLICICCNGGPAFFCSAVGMAVFGSQRIGMMVFLSILIGNTIMAAVMNRLFPIECKQSGRQAAFRGEMLSESVAAAGVNLFKICGMILLFQSLACLLQPILDRLGLTGSAGKVICGFLEISNLSAVEGLPYRLLPFITAAGAFGGLCVIMQIHTIIGKRFSLKPFFLARIISAVISGAVFTIIWKYFGEKYVAASAGQSVIVNMNNFIPSICLIMMIFLTVLRKNLHSDSEI